ncbi:MULTISPECIES: copper resistance protein CopA [unclassified Agarivorans]|uniref:copper resistance protein CopA n=1 Tax=unclassified Agarivorans TaxID=2636026 RepID=UPI0026E2EBC9|nr:MULTISPECIES: copper resistance protein CopA [unclassified Agarivorans]MDO6684078.1 copper resistance protein CopA [Agarivorans sp. 3_MG-2023]MDO6714188.1 copper resistance protein CopA [Agarivorans sp. 2_MG-2023]
MNKFVSILAASTLAFVSVTATAHGEHCKDTKLGTVMKDTKAELKAYVNAYKSDDKAAMQLHATQLLANAKNAKQLIPLKLQDGGHHMVEPDGHPVAVEHSDTNHGEIEGMDHQAHMEHMAEADHFNMNHGTMEGMNHQSHMAHMAYMKGIDELGVLFKQLQQVDDKALIKSALVDIKKHSKRSHKEFRMDCDN